MNFFKKCQSLAMHSFLMLPMQRITRLPLLAEAVLSRLPSDSTQHTAARYTFNQLIFNKLNLVYCLLNYINSFNLDLVFNSDHI